MLKLSLFGPFSIRTASKEITEESLHAPRVFRAMVYLFANRNRRIALRDFSAFLHEGSPASYAAGSDSLVKTTIHRIRTYLAPLQEEEPNLELIVQDGAIRFSPELVFTSDTDRFDEVYRELSEQGSFLTTRDPDRALFLFQTLFSLYKGKYLAPLFGEAFAAPIAKTYHDTYINLCEEYFPLLFHTGRLDDVIRMASEGIAIDPYAETFHYFKIRALAEQGNRALALSLYESVERLFDSHFHIKPSAKLRKLRETLTLSETAESAEEAFVAIQNQYQQGEPLSSDAFAALLSFSQNATNRRYIFMLLTVDNFKNTEIAEHLFKSILPDSAYVCRFSKQQFALLLLAETADTLTTALDKHKIAAKVEYLPI